MIDSLQFETTWECVIGDHFHFRVKLPLKNPIFKYFDQEALLNKIVFKTLGLNIVIIIKGRI